MQVNEENDQRQILIFTFAFLKLEIVSGSYGVNLLIELDGHWL